MHSLFLSLINIINFVLEHITIIYEQKVTRYTTKKKIWELEVQKYHKILYNL